MDGWLSKPFSKEQLATVISTWMSKYPVASPESHPSSPSFSPPSDDALYPVAVLPSAAKKAGDDKPRVVDAAPEDSYGVIKSSETSRPHRRHHVKHRSASIPSAHPHEPQQQHDERPSLHRSSSG
jgi:hypothetical protein